MMLNGSFFLDAGSLSASALHRFLTACPQAGVDLHSLQVWRDGALACRLSLPPYRCDVRQQLYSLSKSFTSTAIGLLYDQGKLRLSDRAIDFFPDLHSAQLSDHARQVTVRDLLTMRAGHADCPFAKMCRLYFEEGTNPLLTFFREDMPHAPGTRFVYNTGATYVLSAIVSQITGQSMLDFLTPRFFAPLGIRAPYWRCVQPGVNAGGVWLEISCDELAKLGLLYFHRGVYGGKRILSEEYIALATGKQADNGDPASGSFWAAGYGFQFWQNAGGGYRGDGAFGQVCLVRPELGLLLVMMSESNDMQRELELLQQLLNDSGTAVGAQTEDDVRLLVEGHTTVPQGGLDDLTPYLGRWRLQGNPFCLTALTVEKTQNGLAMSLSNGERVCRLTMSPACWTENAMTLPGLTPDIFPRGKAIHEDSILFCACRMADGALEVTWRYAYTPHVLTLRLTREGAGMAVTALASQARNQPEGVIRLFGGRD